MAKPRSASGGSDAVRGRDAAALVGALEGLESALGAPVAVVEDGGLDGLDAEQLVGFLQRSERVRNRLPLVDHPVLAEAQARGLAEALTQPSLARLLVSALRLSAGEAHRRVRAAEALTARTTMTGERLGARRPLLAAAEQAGDVSQEQVHVILSALDRVDRRGFDPVDVTTGERLLTEQAAVFDPKVLGQLAVQVVDAIDPDGTVPAEQLAADRRHLDLRARRDGTWVGEFRLTASLGAKLSAVLRPLARPRAEHLPAIDGDRRRTGGAGGAARR